jgi:hypothetical protein
MTRASYIAFMIFASSAAHAETVRIATSTVTLQPSDEPGAVAEIIFVNKPSNGPFNNGNYYLSMDGIDVTVEFE